MLKTLLERVLGRYKRTIYAEADYMKGFMALLMKQRNTGIPWTRAEVRLLKRCLWHLAHYVPFTIVFILPFGSLLLPFMAEVLDRRRDRRPIQAVAACPLPVFERKPEGNYPALLEDRGGKDAVMRSPV